jgi:micrococcal nuclease
LLLPLALMLVHLAWPAGALAAAQTPLRGIVIRAIDGESLEVRVDGRLEVVRYVGIGTPAIHHPVKGAEPYRRAATMANAALVEGREVTLQPGERPRDAAGRLLAFVRVEGRLVSAELVRLGFAEVVTAPPNVDGRRELSALLREAQAARVGLWADAEALRFYRPARSGVRASLRTMSFFHVDDDKGFFEERREDFDSPEAAARAGYVPSFDYGVYDEREQRARLAGVERFDDAARRAATVLVVLPPPPKPAVNMWRGGAWTSVPSR